ncbi:U3 small nucleolar ribonucleoprotein protein IMP4-like [Amphibalanus amphitrite]|uniref:U3 small nucleolar ribonucleoprotein protein IMP4-like n=1 Tax=Amphibalanus amphitrite TaxID=1232801 RepID=UPI001C907B70|nr:U3 small nucleolar ribonucleoprotein protein IMP4-like [Amphibalanus amphitrite]XP_043221995.1 U3 small nucleolar ribonucleoprotein protein IMP4-like [Amphibalanus amphitrite]XP_043221996.1 U3 small nucleolar ribonucleoprotein protein IMP4-like [Amphibalanus amphitrite]
MLRRQARLRREYLYRKSIEEKQRTTQDKKDRLKAALAENRPLETDLRYEGLRLHEQGEWDDAGPRLATEAGTEQGGASSSHVDDEYRWAGVHDPKIIITTSRNPSSRLKKFAKEMKLIFPNAQRMNRGGYELGQLLDACRANGVTDFIKINEHRGEPAGLTVCHLPYGPTAHFTLLDVVMRHDIPEIGTMSEQYPHLVFHNFKTKLGRRVQDILKYLFPVPKEDSKRVLTFINHDDYILFRHHTYRRAEGGGRELELSEAGPRFLLKLYEIRLGTPDQGTAAEVEWVLRPYMNTARKRRFLSDEDAWEPAAEEGDEDEA